LAQNGGATGAKDNSLKEKKIEVADEEEEEEEMNVSLVMGEWVSRWVTGL
jgi:hypothetical protein